MTIETELNKCTSVNSLQEFCKSLDKDEIKFDGRNYINNKNKTKLLSLEKLTNRIIDIYNKNASEEDKKLKTSEEIIQLILDLKSITKQHCTEKSKGLLKGAFGEGSSLNTLRETCKSTVIKSEEVMKTIIFNYNKIAKDYNAHIENPNDSTRPKAKENEQKYLQKELHQLEFLNEFLGIKWDRGHRKGEAPVPLCRETGTAIIGAPVPKTLQPSECMSLRSLLQLTRTLRENVTITHDSTVEVSGIGKISIKEIGKRACELHAEEMKKNPYVKSDIYLETAAIIFALTQLSPVYKKNLPKEVNDLFNKCISEIKKDPISMGKVTEEYNLIVYDINHNLHFDMKMSNIEHLKESPKIQNKNLKDNIQFLNLFLDFPLTNEHYEEKAIFPHAFNLNIPGQLSIARSQYNFYAMMLNHEQHVLDVHNRYNMIKHELYEDNLTTLLIDNEKKKELKNELNKLEAEVKVLGEPFPKTFIDSVIKEENRLAKLLGIELTADQKKGIASYRVMGREISNPENYERPLQIQLPYIINFYNQMANIINQNRQYRDKKIDYNQQRIALSDKLTIDTFAKAPNEFNRMEAMQKELEEMEEKNSYLIEYDRFAIFRLSEILQQEELAKILNLNPEQKAGKEDLPHINPEIIPFPGKEIILKELKTNENLDFQLLFNNWPDHWKKEAENIPEIQAILKK